MKNIYSSTWTRWVFTITLLLTLLAGSTYNVNAAGYDDDGIIEADEVVYDDVFLEGNTVRVDGTVNGNVIATANRILINGTINGDAFLFGNEVILSESARIDGNLFTGAQTVEVSGTITGSLACGSSALTINDGAKILRNVYSGGFSLETEGGSVIGVDLYTADYQVVLNGTIERDVNIAAGAVDLNGNIGGDATLDMGEAADAPYYFPSPPGAPPVINPGLRVSEDAEIVGDLTYTYSRDQSDEIEALPEGQVIFHTPVPFESERTEIEYNVDHKVNFNFWDFIFGRFVTNILKTFWKNLFSLLLLGALAVHFLPSLFKRTVAQLRSKPWPSAGYGILTVAGGYISVLLAGIVILSVSILLTALSLGGLRTATFGFGFAALSLITTVFTMLILYGSKLVICYVVGEWIVRKIAPQSKASQSTFWPLALGIFLYAILRTLPFVGWIFALLAIIFGMGAMWLVWQNRRNVNADVEVIEATVE
ncbi:MAG: polymer-forming cytoskeletal protein [Anaerolineaceae bacterium]|nr:polymer-forming cytoskeletal protein [Anaerolineaceae bacterium]